MALPESEFQRRRGALSAAVDRPIVLLAGGVRDRNLPGYGHPHRSSSDMLYVSGCGEPGAAALLIDGALELYLPVAPPGDALWHGPQTTLEARAQGCFVSEVRPIAELEGRLSGLLSSGGVATVASPDPAANERLAWWTHRALRFGVDPGDDDLVDALCALRRRKSASEIEAMRTAAALSADAHLLVAAAAKPGVSERSLAAMFEASLANAGATPGYGTILTRRGEILHCHDHSGRLALGDLLLVDGGGELGPAFGNAQGYGADLTRTWPIGGRFVGRQRAAYSAVLAAWQAAVDSARPGVRYRVVHDASASVIAEFLRAEGILTIAAEEAVGIGAHGLFFPHGVGHLLGLDVHDLEAFGDRGAYPPGEGRADIFGTRFLRLNLPLEPGFVVTIEPGFYAVPSILHDPTLRERFKGCVDWAKAEAWLGFGGIRIEDDVAIAESGIDVLSEGLPRSLAGVEAAMATRLDLAAALLR